MFVQRGSHENFLCTDLKVFGLQYIFDCINSHSDILSFSCIDLPLKKVTHASLMVCLIYILNNTVPCLRDLLIFVNPRHSFSPYTCSIHVAG